ncbi:imelysin family protein [Psychroflexus planctonicus]|uniref:Iron-regulated protein A n=1 Tax=Psychroflexus planctonicus TaxID=1526575 RepID=A0ABQ1SEE2_9FLAO|nr:imelysin family protein [Psychroflexus planctonicus]GGE30792.1 iron-regulated protein A precursor [Psychroflexus planctonicus]
MMKRTFLALFALVLLWACSSDDEGTNNNPNDGFNRSAMLTNWADNIIIPVYEDLNTKLDELVSQKDNFIAEPNAVNLDNLRTAWQEAYLVWQHAEMFNIGMAENMNYLFQMNVYPTNVSDIQNNIQNQNYDLASVNNNDAVGFPALDYMLHGVGDTDNEIIEFYTASAQAENNKAYLSDLSDQMKSLTQNILDDWKNGYRDSFVSSTNNSATGSINLLVNDFIYYYEKGFRANKFGIPAGNFSTNPLPDRVEAYYKDDFSKALALEGMTAIQNFFNGIAYQSGNDGQSLDDYLDYLETTDDGEKLSFSINNQYTEAYAKIETLDNSFAQQVQTNNVAMTETFDVIQLAVVLMKVDMLQALDISVDFVDADGD